MTKQTLWLVGFVFSCFAYPALATSSTTPSSTSSATTVTHPAKTTQTTSSHTAATPAKKTTPTAKSTTTTKSSHTTKVTPASKTKATAKKREAYTFDFNPPRSSDWQMVQNVFDKNGYARTYMLPQVGDTTPESVTISYGLNIHTPVKASMQEVVDNFKKINCKQKQSHLIQQKKDALVFSTTINQCNNGKALTQIFKVFNMPDGQYSIIYSADPRKTPASTIAAMQKAVIDGKLVPIPAS